MLFFNLLRKIKEKKKLMKTLKKLKMNMQGNIKESITLFFPFKGSLALCSFVKESFTMDCIVEVIKDFMVKFSLSVVNTIKT